MTTQEIAQAVHEALRALPDYSALPEWKKTRKAYRADVIELCRYALDNTWITADTLWRNDVAIQHRDGRPGPEYDEQAYKLALKTIKAHAGEWSRVDYAEDDAFAKVKTVGGVH